MGTRRIAVVLGVVSALALASPVAAPAQGPTELFVTVVARECPAYTDITANRARNNIQESLRDLGADTLYAAGEAIDPGKERTGQPACTPIPDWRFTLGTGIRSRAVTGPWGALSIVTGAFDTGITTQDRVPLRDYAGRPTSESIAGATTIQLTRAQAERAARASSLWIQGGTVIDPVLDDEFPGQFGFGALRCSVDNLNGDNVEWITFPQGSAHVFCYAYYVRPPPTSGTIVIRKTVSGTAGATQPFGFSGNLSYNPGGLFSLRVENGRAASQTFYRAATGPDDEPWVVQEDVPDGWALAGIECRSGGGSAVTTDPASARTEIRLAAGDTVTCTYTDEVRPPAGDLFLNKITRGGLGRFAFEVTPAGEDEPVGRAIAETAEEGVPVAADPSPVTLDPGRYEIRETPPRTERGRWRLDGVTCNGLPLENLARVEVDIADRRGATCTFENSFVPAGEIRIDKVTLGGVARTGFVIERRGDPPQELRQTAVTTSPGVPARAEGSDTGDLELGTWVIAEQAPTAGVSQDWSLVQVVCNGEAVPSVNGRVEVTLTGERPSVRCTFTNVLVAEPVGPPPPDRHVPGRPDPELSVTKRADRRTAIAGELVTYRVTVRNRGRATAENLVINDLRPPGTSVVAARAGRQPCRTGRVLHCRVRALRPGREVTATLRLRVLRAGSFANAAVLHTTSPERVRLDNGDVARVRVQRARCVPRAAAAALAPRARAAC